MRTLRKSIVYLFDELSVPELREVALRWECAGKKDEKNSEEFFRKALESFMWAATKNTRHPEANVYFLKKSLWLAKTLGDKRETREILEYALFGGYIPEEARGFFIKEAMGMG